ncbi:MAG: hypothetical protein ABL963_06220 [Longimicrobiales bacterium]
MAVGTEENEVGGRVVGAIPIDVVEFERHDLPQPLVAVAPAATTVEDTLAQKPAPKSVGVGDARPTFEIVCQWAAPGSFWVAAARCPTGEVLRADSERHHGSLEYLIVAAVWGDAKADQGLSYRRDRCHCRA